MNDNAANDKTDDNSFGGARPKTGQKTRDSRTHARYRSGHGLESDPLDQTQLDNQPSGWRRANRDFRRTNSSDSVFVVDNDVGDNFENCAAVQSRNDRGSYGDEWATAFTAENLDWEKHLMASDNISYLKANLVNSSESNLPSIANSALSLCEGKSEDPPDVDAMEDDCYIYTYKGGTAYLSADLPNSFFRLDSGSDGESLPGVSGAGQSNLSTGVAALLQDQLLHVPAAHDSADEEQDFLELDFDPGSDDSESSNDSGQGREVDQALNSLGWDSPPVASSPPRISMEPGLLSPYVERTSRSSSSRHASQGSLRENAEFNSLSPENHNSPLASNPALPLAAVAAASVANALPPPVSPPPSNSSRLMPVAGFAKTLQTADLVFQNNNNSVDKDAGLTNCQDRYCSSQDSRPKQDRPKEGGLTSPSLVRSVPITSPTEESPPLQSIPRSKSLNNNMSGCLAADNLAPDDENILLCGNRLLVREAFIFGRDNVDLKEALSRLCVSEKGDSSGNEAARSMIWEEKEASRKHVSQLGTSACGATAVMNVLVALNFNADEAEVCRAVRTRLRRGNSPIPDYLLSRSEAGCNHTDLIDGVRKICGGRVVGRFFPMHNRIFNLCPWLSGWISRGCVPVATLNLQRAVTSPGAQIADAWHHQMIWGVSGRNVYLTNHLEVLPEQSLTPQLDSPSELLIRREDVISRWSEGTDLSPLVTDPVCFDQRWSDANVLGQIVNLVREEKAGLASETDSLSLTSHLRIPAYYESGITLFCDASNHDVLALLYSTADLPFRSS